jgi:hypothetical protein
MLYSFGSRELCQPSRQVDGKPDAESNLSLRVVQSRIDAVLSGPRRPFLAMRLLVHACIC